MITGAPGELAVADKLPAAAVYVFPNPTPADSYLYLPAPARVTLLDAVGRTLFVGSVPGGRVLLPLHAQPPGVYSVRVVTAAAAVVRRVVRE